MRVLLKEDPMNPEQLLDLYIQRIQDRFRAKTGWGKNQILDVLDEERRILQAERDAVDAEFLKKAQFR
jgi:hypothetical protein